MDAAARWLSKSFSAILRATDAEDDLAVARISVEATHVAPLFGIPPSHRLVRDDSIVVYTLRDGRIVERWCRERRSTRQILVEAAGASPRGAVERP